MEKVAKRGTEGNVERAGPISKNGNVTRDTISGSIAKDVVELGDAQALEGVLIAKSEKDFRALPSWYSGRASDL